MLSLGQFTWEHSRKATLATDLPVPRSLASFTFRFLSLSNLTSIISKIVSSLLLLIFDCIGTPSKNDGCFIWMKLLTPVILALK